MHRSNRSVHDAVVWAMNTALQQHVYWYVVFTRSDVAYRIAGNAVRNCVDNAAFDALHRAMSLFQKRPDWDEPLHPALQDFLREAEVLRPVALLEPMPYRSLGTYPNPIALIHEEVRPTAMHLVGRFGVTALTIAVYGAAKLRFSLDDGSN